MGAHRKPKKNKNIFVDFATPEKKQYIYRVKRQARNCLGQKYHFGTLQDMRVRTTCTVALAEVVIRYLKKGYETRTSSCSKAGKSNRTSNVYLLESRCEERT